MDSGERKKRPREEDSPIDSQLKRRGPFTAASNDHSTPLPQHVGHYPSESDTLSHPRRLPPLYTPSRGSSSKALTTSSSILSSPSHYQACEWRPRSQSLSDFCQQPSQKWYETASERTETDLQDPEKSRYGSHPHHHPVGNDPAPHAAGGSACCSSRCQGQGCSDTRALMRKLTTELALFDFRVRSLLQKDHHSSSDSVDLEVGSFLDSLQWALDIVRLNNLSLQDHFDHSQPRSPEQNESLPDTSTMKRGHHYLGQREDRHSPDRQCTSSQHAYSGFTHPGMAQEQNRGNSYGGEVPNMPNSPHLTASSSGSVFMPQQSPMHAPQPTRPGTLPSPSSMNFSNPPPNLPPISPSSAAVQNSAQTAHLQDLQHQISVKTLALQTLQREYDSLLQKLERQRTKCATLEKKFEVSDVEINSLTDEKENLQAQIITLEKQVEELQQSRDDSRRQLVANGAQYMRIMEMANRLQAQSAEDKKRWEAEKAELQQRINVLEEAMVTGTDARNSPPPSIIMAHSVDNIFTTKSTTSPSTETFTVLRNEIGRLRLRTQSLESALHTMRDESAAIHEAAKKLQESGDRMKMVTKGALSG